MSQSIYPVIYDLLEELNKPRATIIETGCTYTRTIARWVQSHPESNFTSVDLNFGVLLETHRDLEKDGTARYCTFLSQDHRLCLSGRTWVDAVFLNPADLEDGQEQFLLAVSGGARLVVVTDYQSRGAWAIKRAKEIGWTYESLEDINILRRPKS